MDERLVRAFQTIRRRSLEKGLVVGNYDAPSLRLTISLTVRPSTA